MDSKAKAGKYCFYCYTIIKWSCFHGLKQQANVKYLLQSFKLENNKIKNFVMKFLKVEAGGDGKVKFFFARPVKYPRFVASAQAVLTFDIHQRNS